MTWAGMLASRVSRIIGCAFIAAYLWWLGPLLLVMWVLVRRAVLGTVLRQATDLRGQTTAMRRAWYFTGVGSKKLALGRAMRAQAPLLVVLDEPTASLDAHAEHALFSRYAAAADTADEGTITLLVSHRFSTVRMADLIIYLEAGGAAESAATRN